MSHRIQLILIAIIASVTFFGEWIPLYSKQLLYSISLSIKNCIIFLLPFIIFSLLFRVTVSLSSKATKFILLVLAMVCVSNFCSTFLSHYLGILIYQFDLTLINPDSANTLKPLYTISLPVLLSNNYAMIASILFGTVYSYSSQAQAINFSLKIEKVTNTILSILVYFIPLFIVGFLLKMQYDGAMKLILRDYSKVIAVVIAGQFSYIILLYIIFNKFSIFNAFRNISNMLPAAISGLTTMSSAVSMPLTIIGVEKNSKNKELARSIIPLTVNIHLIGDCFAIPIFAYAVLKSFGMPEPSLANYLIFTCYFVLAKFSVAAIPGGGIIIMLPILEKYMNFNTEMISLITALYILFDPIITSVNVLGNGAFAKMADRLS